MRVAGHSGHSPRGRSLILSLLSPFCWFSLYILLYEFCLCFCRLNSRQPVFGTPETVDYDYDADAVLAIDECRILIVALAGGPRVIVVDGLVFCLFIADETLVENCCFSRPSVDTIVALDAHCLVDCRLLLPMLIAILAIVALGCQLQTEFNDHRSSESPPLRRLDAYYTSMRTRVRVRLHMNVQPPR